jgi:hypothetical protein
MSAAVQSAASRRAAALEHSQPVLQELPQPVPERPEQQALRSEQPRLEQPLERASEAQPPRASRPLAQKAVQPQQPVTQTPQPAAQQPVP